MGQTAREFSKNAGDKSTVHLFTDLTQSLHQYLHAQGDKADLKTLQGKLKPLRNLLDRFDTAYCKTKNASDADILRMNDEMDKAAAPLKLLTVQELGSAMTRCAEKMKQMAAKLSKTHPQDFSDTMHEQMGKLDMCISHFAQLREDRGAKPQPKRKR